MPQRENNHILYAAFFGNPANDPHFEIVKDGDISLKQVQPGVFYFDLTLTAEGELITHRITEAPGTRVQVGIREEADYQANGVVIGTVHEDSNFTDNHTGET